MRVCSLRLKLIAVGVSIFAGLTLFTGSVHAAKINFSPTPLTITEGQTQVITVTTDEPIICPIMDSTCNISITITSGTPARLTITGSPLVIPLTEWAQPHTFSVTAVDDALDNGDVVPVLTRLATSNSEYYSNFSPTFAVTVLDNDDPASVTVPQPTDVPTLAGTGINIEQHLALAIAFLLASAITLIYRNQVIAVSGH